MHVVCVLVCAVWAAAGGGGARGEVRRAGWLDRVVLHYKNNFLEDLKQLAPVNIQASIEKAPSGYTDSPEWDFDSVTRLLGLLRASETARPVRRALRRALAPPGGGAAARRFMSRQKSYKFFPSLAQMHMSNMYYDVDTDADYATSEEDLPGGVPPPHAVVLVRNPVEARLPSARISVGLLREILEARALAARKMPPTKTTSGWIWTTKAKNETGIGVTTPGQNETDSSTLESAQNGTDSTTDLAHNNTDLTTMPGPGQNSTDSQMTLEPGQNGTDLTTPESGHTGTDVTTPADATTVDTN